MKITFDKEADEIYIEFTNENFASNKIIDDDTILDLDEKGNILGIEILNASKRIARDFLSDISVKNLIV
mgnify:CR=1 FL=1